MNNNLSELRKIHRLTQKELANIVGVSRQTIISIERGKYIASLPLAIKIARVFSVHVEDIFFFEEE